LYLKRGSLARQGEKELKTLTFSIEEEAFPLFPKVM